MNFVKKYAIGLIGLLLLHLFLLFNLEFTAWPEMLSFPYLLNNGFKLYGDMVHAYPPLLTIVLSVLYKIFGYQVLVLQIFTWSGILMSDILIFLIVKDLTGNKSYSLLAVIFYVLTQPFLDGNMLWFDTALAMPVLLLLYFRKNSSPSGIILSLAFLIKQTAVFYIAAYLIYLLMRKEKVKNIFRFAAPIVLVSGSFLGYLYLNGEILDYYKWNFLYPATFWTKYPSYEILSLTKRDAASVLLVVFPSLCLLVLSIKDALRKKGRLLAVLLLFAGVMAIYPRFSFYHFQPVVGIGAVLFGLLLAKTKIKPIFVFFYLSLIALFIAYPVIRTSWWKEVRFFDGESKYLAEVVGSETKDGGKAYLLGPHSGIYVMADRLPPKPWIDNYGWYFEIPGVQEETVASWEKDPPEVIIVQDPLPGEWFRIGSYQPRKVVEWIGLNYNKEREIVSGTWLWRKK